MKLLCLSAFHLAVSTTSRKMSKYRIRKLYREKYMQKYLTYTSMEEDPSSKVVIPSPSGDTDILVLAVALLDSYRVYLDYGKGKLRRGFWLNSISMDDQLKRALIGFHAFTGNDYVSSFLKKGKQMPYCLLVMQRKSQKVVGWLMVKHNWVDDIFPLEIEEILCDQAYNADDDFDEEDEQSSSDDDN
ncbi:hypothetical protein GQR58_021587 [Nymphon striatum]|nr:hypothetical protein GQR58_021587 [Nymphon striatum]